MRIKHRFWIFAGYLMNVPSIPFFPLWLTTAIYASLVTATFFLFHREIKCVFIKFFTFFKPVHHHHHYHVSDNETGVVHFGTKYGHLSVHMGGNKQTQKGYKLLADQE